MKRRGRRNAGCFAALIFFWPWTAALWLATQTPSVTAFIFESPNSFENNNDRDSHNHVKTSRICGLSGGLHLTRFLSTQTRQGFAQAVADVELMREYLSEAALNGGLAGGLHSLQALDTSIDWQGRQVPQGSTMTGIGLGYDDDRADRRMERCVSLTEDRQPFVGTKETDAALADAASNLFPWIVDRQAATPAQWYVSHPNGQLPEQPLQSQPSSHNNNNTDTPSRLYTAAWVGTAGEAWWYYPPLPRSTGMAPLSCSDNLGPRYNSRNEPFVAPNWPSNADGTTDTKVAARLTVPYADVAIAGLSMITAMAPVYYTGTFTSTDSVTGQTTTYTYNDTYIASTGVDVSLASLATLLENVQDAFTVGSFAVLVSVRDAYDESDDGVVANGNEAPQLPVVAISQAVVQRLYPARTGMEEARVVKRADGSVVDDRRNVTYLVSDTLHQPLGPSLDNANWTALARHVQDKVARGSKASFPLNITLTGDDEATPFYVLTDRWATVADWALMVFVPQNRLDHAVDVTVNTTQVDLEIWHADGFVNWALTVSNHGYLDVTVEVKAGTLPAWLTLAKGSGEPGVPMSLPSGGNLTLSFTATTDTAQSGLVALSLEDDNYPDCFYENVVTTKVTAKIVYDMDLHQLDALRPFGYCMAAIIIVSTLVCSMWVHRFTTHRVVRAAQPLFLHVICAGIAVMGMAILPMGMDDSVLSSDGCSRACMAVPWLLALGFSIVFSALFSKIWRVNQIVQALTHTHKRVNVEVHHVIIPFFVIFGANVFLLTLWTILDPLVWVRETAGEGIGMDEFHSYGSCQFSTEGASIVFCALLLAVNFLALLLALVQFFRARGLSSEYSEGKYIAIAIGSSLQVVLTGVPIMVMVDENSPGLLYFCRVCLVFVTAMSILLLIFVPKMVLMKNGGGSQSSVGPSSGNYPVVKSVRDDSRLGRRSGEKVSQDFISVSRDTGFQSLDRRSLSDITQSVATVDNNCGDYHHSVAGGCQSRFDEANKGVLKNAVLPQRLESVMEEDLLELPKRTQRINSMQSYKSKPMESPTAADTLSVETKDSQPAMPVRRATEVEPVEEKEDDDESMQRDEQKCVCSEIV